MSLNSELGAQKPLSQRPHQLVPDSLKADMDRFFKACESRSLIPPTVCYHPNRNITRLIFLS